MTSNSSRPTTAATVTYASLAVMVWTYVGYPVALKAMSRNRVRPRHSLPQQLPSVTVLVPAYNEADFIAKKIVNSRSLHYPADLLDVLVVNDGSDDGTGEIARLEGATVIDIGPRSGKANALNVGMARATGDICVITDANGLLDPDSLEHLVAEFTDPEVAVVGGSKVPVGDGAHGGGEEAYWRYENFLKSAEGSFGCSIGVDGGVMAIRRSTWRALRPGTLSDDLLIALDALERGHKVHHSDDVRAVEATSLSVEDEFERRTRIAAGTWQGLVWYRSLLSPRRPFLAMAFGTHRGLRTAVVPLLLPVVFVASLVGARRSRVLRLLAWLQAGSWGAAAVGATTDSRAFAAPFQFAATNVAAVRGGLRYFSGRQKTVWRRTSRGTHE